MYIRDLMTTQLRTCRPTDTLEDAVRLMWLHDVGVLPVVDDEVLVGIVTDRDAAIFAFSRKGDVHAAPVREVMTVDAWTCRETDTIEVAERLMAEHRVRRLPVVDGADKLVGILSIDDLARESVAHGVQIPPRELVHTLGAIATRRMFPVAES